MTSGAFRSRVMKWIWIWITGVQASAIVGLLKEFKEDDLI